MPSKRSDLKKDAYTARSGKGHGKGHPFGGGRRETATIASKQRHGGPKHGGMEPRPGFPSLPME